MAEVVHNDRQIVRFYEEAVLDMAKSETAQRPIFKDMVLCEIKWVGSRLQSTVIPAHEKFRPRRASRNMRGQFGFENSGGMESPAEAFPEEWAEFQGLASARQGTLLEQMPGMTKARIAELNYMNIHTAEQLASLGDDGIRALGIGGRALVEQARTWIAEATDKARLAAEMEKNAALEARFAELEAKIAAANAPKPSDNFETMEEDELRAFLERKGANPRKNASLESMRAAARELSEFAG